MDQRGIETLTIPATTTNNSFNLATMFPSITSAQSISIADMSQPGVAVGFSTVNTGTKFQLRPGGVAVICASGALPTLFFDNAGVNPAYLEITVTGN